MRSVRLSISPMSPGMVSPVPPDAWLGSPCALPSVLIATLSVPPPDGAACAAGGVVGAGAAVGAAAAGAGA